MHGIGAFIESIQSHTVLAPVLFILMRAASVVVAPVPGIALDIPAIGVFGWQSALLYSECGVLLGSSVCFALARRFREPLVRRFVPLQRVQNWEKRLSAQQAFWAWTGLRLTTNPAFDYLSYAAGLTNCSFTMFAATTFLGSLPNMLLFFYLGGTIADKGYYYAVAGIGLLILLGLALERWLFGRKD